MNKKGQVYILAAIIITFLIYLLFSETNVIHETVIQDDFEALSQNYEIEGAKFVNSMIGKNPEDIADAFSEFSSVFTSYAKTKNPDFSLIYMLSYGNDVYIGNYLDEEVTINNDPKALDGCFEEIDTSIVIGGLNTGLGHVKKGDIRRCTNKFPGGNDVNLKVGDVAYNFELQQMRPEIAMVSREKKGEQRKIYTQGKYVPLAPFEDHTDDQATDDGTPGNSDSGMGNRNNPNPIIGDDEGQ